MGVVSDYLRDLIAKQVDKYGLVVWYDPEGLYGDLALSLSIPDTSVERYDGSFLELRYKIEPFMAADEPPRLVVYVPMDQSDTHNALIEAESAGTVMKPGQQPPVLNTRLSVVARSAVKTTGQWTDEDAEQLAKDIEAGKYQSVEEIEQVVTRRGDATGVLQLIFGTGQPDEVALKFLNDTEFDMKLAQKNALPELMNLMSATYGLDVPNNLDAEVYRALLSRHLLSTEFIASLQGDTPSQLATVGIPSSPGLRMACVEFVHDWRQRRNLGDSYASHANRVEVELGLPGIDFSLDQIGLTETFLEIELKLQNLVESALQDSAKQDMVNLALGRQSSFWSEYIPGVQSQWALIAVSGQVILEAGRISKELKSAKLDIKTLLNAYAEGEHPWCLLDTYHRHMERRWHSFSFNVGGDQRGLETLLAKARSRYMDVGSRLAETFVREYQSAKFTIPETPRQRDIFSQRVKPHIGDGKIAYVWVDALRFEMARELSETLSGDFDTKVQAVAGTVPTITEIGMAALLPHASESFSIESAKGNRLAAAINGNSLKDRKDRVAFLEANAGVNIFAAKLDDLLPNPGKKIRDGIAGAGLVLITSQEIDALAESDNVSLARRTMDDMLNELRRAFRVLSNLGVTRIIVTADHGYLFADDLSVEMKIDAPGGDTATLHRRVWVGRGGTADPAYLRAYLSEFGLDDDLEIATPWTFACFKVAGGASAYFHGGMSPQELVIPVIDLIPKKRVDVGAVTTVKWTLVPGSDKITTRFFSVQITGEGSTLLELTPPKVRVEVMARQKIISRPISASYGFEEATGDVQLKLAEGDTRRVEPNTVTLMVTEETDQKSVTVRLLDAVAGTELARLDKVEVAMLPY